jgi:hypothetical protein
MYWSLRLSYLRIIFHFKYFLQILSQEKFSQFFILRVSPILFLAEIIDSHVVLKLHWNEFLLNFHSICEENELIENIF